MTLREYAWFVTRCTGAAYLLALVLILLAEVPR